MLNAHRPSARRRLVGLLASALILLFAALPASQASAAVTERNWPVTSLSGFIWPTDNFLGGISNMRFWHQNGYCVNQSGSYCYQWRSGRGANNFIVYGPYEILPYGYYYVCWFMANTSSPGDHNPTVWVQTTGDSGGRYLGGAVVNVTSGFHSYCYWAGASHAVGNVEFRAIIGNPRYNSQVDIGYPVRITRYY